MELIDRYVADIGRRLPDKMRPDIQKELHSILEDMLEDRVLTAGKPADEQMVVDLLREYGDPAKVAASYHAPRYLVGPALYPTFIMVMKIVVTVIAVLAVIQFGFSVARPGLDPAQIGLSFGEAFSTLFNGFLTALGIVTLIFTLIERFNPGLKIENKEWNPRDLAPLPQPVNQLKTGDLVASVVFNLIVIVVFNVFFDKIGIYNNTDGVWSFIPVFGETLKNYVPYLTALWGLEIGLHVYVLQAGHWNLSTRWMGVAISGGSIILLMIMLTGPSIIQVSPDLLASWESAGLDFLQVGGIQSAMDTGARSVIAIILIAEILELGKQTWALLRSKVPAIAKI
jgi:hypothetical protein